MLDVLPYRADATVHQNRFRRYPDAQYPSQNNANADGHIRLNPPGWVYLDATLIPRGATQTRAPSVNAFQVLLNRKLPSESGSCRKSLQSQALPEKLFQNCLWAHLGPVAD